MNTGALPFAACQALFQHSRIFRHFPASYIIQTTLHTIQEQIVKKFPPISAKCPHMLHGGDYNPDQWQHLPRVLEEDMRLMTLAGCNAMTVGIFAWTALEPREGVYTCDWLDRVAS